MADTSNLTKFLGDIADAIRDRKQTSESIPASEFDTEIMSIDVGVNTDDADAVQSNIEKGKTAYVKGEKLTGTLDSISGTTDVMVAADNILVGKERGYDCVSTTYTNIGKKIYEDGVAVSQHMKFEDLAPRLGVTADKIKKGESVLGVAGTAEGETEINNQNKTFTQNGIYTADNGYTGLGTVTVNVQSGKLREYSSIEAMNADTTASLGDIAIVYSANEVITPAPGIPFQKMRFKSSVTLSSAVTDTLYFGNGMKEFSATRNLMINSTSTNYLSTTYLRLQIYGKTDTVSVTYRSTDAKTYTLSSVSHGTNVIIDNTVDLGLVAEVTDTWDSVLNNFVELQYCGFEGLYEYGTLTSNRLKMYKISNPTAVTFTGYEVDTTNVCKLLVDGFKSLGVTDLGNICLYYDPVTKLFKAYAKQNTYINSANYNANLYQNGNLHIMHFPTSTLDQTNELVWEVVIDVNNNSYTAKKLTQIGTIESDQIPVNKPYYALVPDTYYMMTVKINTKTFRFTPWQCRIHYFNASGILTDSTKTGTTITENAFTSLPNQLSSVTPANITKDMTVYGGQGLVTGDGSIYNNVPYASAINLLYKDTYSNEEGDDVSASFVKQANASDLVACGGTRQFRFVKVKSELNNSEVMTLFTEKYPVVVEGDELRVSYNYDYKILFAHSQQKIICTKESDNTTLEYDLEENEEFVGTTYKTYNNFVFFATRTYVESGGKYSGGYKFYRIDLEAGEIATVDVPSQTIAEKIDYNGAFVDLTNGSYVVGITYLLDKTTTYGNAYNNKFVLYELNMNEFSSFEVRYEEEYLSLETYARFAITNRHNVVICYRFRNESNTLKHALRCLSLSDYTLSFETDDGYYINPTHGAIKSNSYCYEDDTYIYLYKTSASSYIRAWNKTNGELESITSNVDVIPREATYDFTVFNSGTTTYYSMSLTPDIYGVTIGVHMPTEDTSMPYVANSVNRAIITRDGKYYAKTYGYKELQIVPIENVNITDDWDYCLIPVSSMGENNFSSLYLKTANPAKTSGPISQEEYDEINTMAEEVLGGVE